MPPLISKNDNEKINDLTQLVIKQNKEIADLKNELKDIKEKLNNFIKKDYKIKKQEINEELIEITFSLIFFENQKRKILDLTSKLQEKVKKMKVLRKIK